mmetsp:Transcript_27413/g.63421  ORF Transcript_27413/g.63421 Transcript_27413/m.63421 type:complete len:214 (-) Transcript_27413:566-1207(-)
MAEAPVVVVPLLLLLLSSSLSRFRLPASSSGTVKWSTVGGEISRSSCCCCRGGSPIIMATFPAVSSGGPAVVVVATAAAAEIETAEAEAETAVAVVLVVSMRRITLAGTPAKTTLWRIPPSLPLPFVVVRHDDGVTTAPAPTTTPFPKVTPGKIVHPAPNQQLCPMAMGAVSSSPLARRCGSSGCVAADKQTCGPKRQLSPMVMMLPSNIVQP